MIFLLKYIKILLNFFTTFQEINLNVENFNYKKDTSIFIVSLILGIIVGTGWKYINIKI